MLLRRRQTAIYPIRCFGFERIGAIAAQTSKLTRTFAARLTIAFSGVVALTLVLVFVGVINRVDDYFYNLQVNDLQVRALTVRDAIIVSLAGLTTDGAPIVTPTDTLDPAVAAFLANPAQQRILADDLAQADLQVSGELGTLSVDSASGDVSADTISGQANITTASGDGRLAPFLRGRPRPE